MFWITGVSRAHTGFALNTVNVDGSHSVQPLAALTKFELPGKAKRRRVVTDCATWSRASAAMFWEQFQLKGTAPQDDHTVYAFKVGKIQYLLPVCVLIRAFVRPFQYAHPYLFHPQGLDLLFKPILGKVQPTGVFLDKSGYTQKSRPESHFAGYSWMSCFPSARAMWHSVYQAALEGHLDMTLPKASLHMRVHAVAMGDVDLVTTITVTEIHANEAPYPFALGHPDLIIMHGGHALDWRVARNPDSKIPIGQRGWQLTDEEWKAVSAVLPQRHQRAKYDYRSLLDLILLKLGTKTPWGKLDCGGLKFPIVLRTYWTLVQRGDWERVEGLLVSLRCVKAAEPQLIV